MLNKIKAFFQKNFLINQLVQLYSFMLVGVVFLIILGNAFFTIRKTYEEAEKTLDDTVIELSNNIQMKDNMLTNVVWELTVPTYQYDNLRNYMMMSPPDYFNYSIEQWHNEGINNYFPSLIQTMFINYPDIKTMDIELEESDEYLHVDEGHRNGILLPGKPKIQEELTLSRPIKSQGNSELIGTIHMNFYYRSVQMSTKDVKKDMISTFAFSSTGDVIYENYTGMATDEVKELESNFIKQGHFDIRNLSESYLVKSSSIKGISVITLINKKELNKQISKKIAPVIILGLLVIVFLLLTLQKVFSRYSHQVSLIVEGTTQISSGDTLATINTSEMQLELKDVGEAINQMMVHLNQYIEDIYILEVKQRDAHMRALQSQINPHFLYNTLEYIRMYAISEEQDELADVVFAFSALLRNNITQEKTTILKNELNFCEKYVYLYQMRYPDSIAYHFEMEEGLDTFLIPKFLIQPLVENYFVHGIDYSRMDNAISVKAYYDEQKNVEIVIKDNGKGMTEQRLKEVQLELLATDEVVSESIGIKNVFQRLVGYFGQQARLTIESNLEKGVVLTMTIPKERGMRDV